MYTVYTVYCSMYNEKHWPMFHPLECLSNPVQCTSTVLYTTVEYKQNELFKSPADVSSQLWPHWTRELIGGCTIFHPALSIEVAQCYAVQCYRVAVHYSAVQSHTLWYTTVQCSADQCNTVQYIRIQYSVQLNTVQFPRESTVQCSGQ